MTSWVRLAVVWLVLRLVVRWSVRTGRAVGSAADSAVASPQRSEERPAYRDVRPFGAEKLFDLVERRRLPRAALLSVVVLFSALLVVSAAGSGELGSTGAAVRLVRDFRMLTGSLPPDADGYFPLSRDYTAITVATGAALTVPLVYWNCVQMRALVRNITGWDAQGSASADTRFLQLEIVRLDESFRRLGRWRSWACLAAGVLSALLLHATFTREGAFGVLAAGVPVAGVRWWASVRAGHVGGAAAWLTVCALCCYIYIKNNAMGYCFLRFFWRIRRVAWYDIDPLDEDGYYGWRPLRRLLASVYLAILLSGLPAIVYAQSIGRASVVLAAPVLVLLLASIPFLGVAPLALLHWVGERHRHHLVAGLRRDLELRTRGSDRDAPHYLDELRITRGHVRDVADMTPRLFRPTVIVAVLALYVVPLLSFVVGYLRGS